MPSKSLLQYPSLNGLNSVTRGASAKSIGKLFVDSSIKDLALQPKKTQFVADCDVVVKGEVDGVKALL